MRPAARRFLGIVLTVAAAASPAGAERLPIASFTTAHGLVYDRVLRVVRDSHGFLWFCTSQGLSRFDGRQFRSFTAADGLPESVVNDLLETRDGTYWVATDGGGVARFDPRRAGSPSSRFTVYAVGDEHVTAEVYVLRQDRAGHIWAGTRGGLFRLDAGAGRFERVPLDVPGRPDRSLPIWALAEDAEGSLWVGHDHGISRVRPGGAPLHHAVAPFPGGDTVWSLLFDEAGRLWIAHEKTLFVLQPEPLATSEARRFAWRRLMDDQETLLPSGGVRMPAQAGEAARYTTAHGLFGEGPGPLLRASDGHIWVGNRGVSEFDGERFHSYDAAQGLVRSAVISLGEDADGNIWMGTRTSGVMRLFRNGLVGESAPGIAGGDLVTSFVEESPGRVWAVLAPGRLRRYGAGEPTTLALGLPRDAFRVGRPGPYAGIRRDRQGDWWAGTAIGLYRFPAVAAEALPRTPPRAIYGVADGLAADGTGILFEDRDGDLWIGHTTAGPRVLSRRSASTGRFSVYGAADGLPPNRVSSLAQDASGRLLVGFYEGGVARQAGDRFEMLPGIDPAAMGAVSALHVDAADRLWIATSRAGLRRLDDPGAAEVRLLSYGAADGLASNAVRALAADRWGRLYVATLGGIDCLDPETLRPLRRFTQAHGLANFFFEAAYRDARGTLWFGTSEGVARLEPRDWAPRPPPPVRIAGLRVSGVPQPVADVGETVLGPLSFAPHQNTLEIEFLSLEFAGEPRLFQYRLEGTGEDWGAPTTRPDVHYAHLAPGRYRFQVRAVGGGGQAVAVPAEVAFTIVAPLWERGWFRAGVALAVVLAAYAAYRLRLARLLALERVRTRIATDLHDDIGSSLSQIAIMSELAARRSPHDDAVGEPLRRIAESSRELVDAMSDIVWAINPRRDRLGELVNRMRRFASDAFTARDIAFRFDAPEGEGDRPLATELRRQVLLIFKEAVNNLVRHSRCGRAEVELRLDGGRLFLRVADDGRGFEPGTASDGQGLGSMRSRAEQLGGRLEVVSVPGRGTALTLSVPVRWRPRPPAGRPQATDAPDGSRHYLRRW